ncbi:DNA-binding transcriptional regulator, MerR family [Andreprevotia lacus DSM 23236]|jgi:DNA-binding transcriptional MerR regulator|uniref:DNA-binding transcriptional regulator, MerR family n=1 Tax=Andreprevotia lacus DSM 23236 TaxID=1121001 RepID=A0A1W1XVP5_9NEIS|nr:MerR family transcriptional regulator [Andreprevotia lacus]SMC28060.1 DNA-binding transcriptional regulator, MerR family [Andreprevotia lacus DSM 23236]
MMLSIRDVATQTGLTAHTLRYYEAIGLLGPISRSRSGQRQYSPADLNWLAFLLRLRSTGMGIRDMQRYATLRREGATLQSVQQREALLVQHAARLEDEIGQLQQTLAVLHDKIALYRTQAGELKASCSFPSQGAQHASTAHPEPDH